MNSSLPAIFGCFFILRYFALLDGTPFEGPDSICNGP